MRQINQKGLELIKSFEGILDGNPATVNLDPYVDPVGIYTIGWGHAIRFGKGFLTTRTANHKRIARQLYPVGITKQEAEELLRADITGHAGPIENLIQVTITDNQWAAVVSLTFNIGVGAFRRSTVLRELNRGRFEAAARAFALWNRGGGKVLKGLVRRRAAEAALFMAEGDANLK